MRHTQNRNPDTKDHYGRAVVIKMVVDMVTQSHVQGVDVIMGPKYRQIALLITRPIIIVGDQTILP